MSLILIAAVVGYTTVSDAPPAQRTSRLPAPSRPLAKPEPVELLSDPGLGLSEAQRQAILAVDREWRGQKSDLLAAMAGYQPRHGRVDQVSEALGGYAQLSRQYNATREKAWSAALALLDSTQKGKVRP